VFKITKKLTILACQMVDRIESQSEFSDLEGIRLFAAPSQVLDVAPVAFAENAVVHCDKGRTLKKNKKNISTILILR
jgi:hypothetical protein